MNLDKEIEPILNKGKFGKETNLLIRIKIWDLHNLGFGSNIMLMKSLENWPERTAINAFALLLVTLCLIPITTYSHLSTF